ncbi:MAG: CBS domain-containing protein [Pseudomonadota bacterium]
MKISAILGQKPVSDVSWITPSSTVTQALKSLADKGIGTLLISTDGKLADGILSERDIVRALSRQGNAALSLTVDQIMTARPVTCTRDDNSGSVLVKMTEGRFRHMPVTETDGTLVGLVSIGDIVKAHLSDLEQEREALVEMISGR